MYFQAPISNLAIRLYRVKLFKSRGWLISSRNFEINASIIFGAISPSLNTIISELNTLSSYFIQKAQILINCWALQADHLRGDSGKQRRAISLLLFIPQCYLNFITFSVERNRISSYLH